jgi:hypothetical protein
MSPSEPDTAPSAARAPVAGTRPGLTRLLCGLGLHRAGRVVGHNNGYSFARCARCGRDLVREPGGKWREPRGYRVVWRTLEDAEARGDWFRRPDRLAPAPAVPQPEAKARLEIQTVLDELPTAPPAGEAEEPAEPPSPPPQAAAPEPLDPWAELDRRIASARRNAAVEQEPDKLAPGPKRPALPALPEPEDLPSEPIQRVAENGAAKDS